MTLFSAMLNSVFCNPISVVASEKVVCQSILGYWYQTATKKVQAYFSGSSWGRRKSFIVLRVIYKRHPHREGSGRLCHKQTNVDRIQGGI